MLLLLALVGCKPTLAPLETDGPTAPGSELLGIGVAPRDPIAQVGEEVDFVATAYFANTTYDDVTSTVTWTVSNDRVASIGADGVLTALSEGTTEVVATDDSGKGNSVTLRVLGDGATLQAVTVNPSTVSLNVGANVQLAATATYSDSTTGTLGAACRWSSSSDSTATVDPAGRVTGVAAGAATVTATCSGFTSDAAVTVVEASVDLGEPDLRAVGATAYASGLDVFWQLQVRNDGTGASAGFFVDAYLDSAGQPAPGGVGFAATRYVSGLSPGESVTVMLEELDTTAGSHSTWILIDPEDYVEESNEGNNAQGPLVVETVEPLLGPDLVIRHFFAFTDGFETEYLFEIENVGDVPSETFYLDLFLDQATAPAFDCIEYGDEYTTVPALAPGERFTWDPIVPSAPDLFSSWTSWAAIDLCDDVIEANENDNLESYVVEE